VCVREFVCARVFVCVCVGVCCVSCILKGLCIVVLHRKYKFNRSDFFFSVRMQAEMPLLAWLELKRK
jgi:hypothetical protein